MIKLSSLLLEKFELPPELNKQLENTAYSALGYVLTPQYEKFKKLLFSSKELNEKSYNSLKNVFDTIRKMTGSSGGNTTLTYTDVLVPKEYLLLTTKKEMKNAVVTIEKSIDAIYVLCKAGKEELFSMVIHKDYAGWDLERLNRFWKQTDDGYKQFEKVFDDRLVLIENLIKKLENWKTLDKPKKPKTHPGGQKAMLVYEKDFVMNGEYRHYEHYFRVLPSRQVDNYDVPDHFYPAETPRIVQTIYLNTFNPETSYNRVFDYYVNGVMKASKHEGRHLLQHYGKVSKQLKGDYYGGPKKDISHSKLPDVRGLNPGGAADPRSKHKDPTDVGNRVFHPYRSIEFKTNLYDYKDQIETFLSANLPRNKWQQGFRDLLEYTVGKQKYNQFMDKFPSAWMWENTTTKEHLKQLFVNDRAKFDAMIRELYKLIFV